MSRGRTTASQLSPRVSSAQVPHAGAPQRADHELAEHVQLRDFACLARVRHATAGQVRRMRRLPGITGVIESEGGADLQLIVSARSPRAAQRACVELVVNASQAAEVTVPDVVDYDEALLDYLDRHGDFARGSEEEYAAFDDSEVVALALDRG